MLLSASATLVLFVLSSVDGDFVSSLIIHNSSEHFHRNTHTSQGLDGLRHTVVRTDTSSHRHTVFENLVSCVSHSCGEGAYCSDDDDEFPNLLMCQNRMFADCRSHQACVNQRCIDPCFDACGDNALCQVRNHYSICSCPPGFAGDPFISCKLEAQEVAASEEACHPSPCGANTECRVINNYAVCSCLSGYEGAPPRCVHECESDEECSDHLSCRNFKCVSPCSDCGTNANCEIVTNHQAICKCAKGYIGDPYQNCTAECLLHTDCPKNKGCFYNTCINPCFGVCGTNAKCQLHGPDRIPVCYCPTNMTGDPFFYCRPIEIRDACEPNPCGTNARCSVGRDFKTAVCYCPPGYSGNPFISCKRAECDLDSKCSANLACLNMKCVDPCLGNKTQCGTGAVCKARNHVSACSCPKGYHGDAQVKCRVTHKEVATTDWLTFKLQLLKSRGS